MSLSNKIVFECVYNTKKEKSRTKINAVSPVGEGKFFILNKEYSICVI